MKRFFNLDFHISVIADIKHILKDRIEIVDWSLSGHTWVFEKQPDVVDCINHQTWMNFDHELIRSFQSKYDDFLSSFDGFIVGHPNVFVMLYEKYNKPIIMVNSCRYDMPFSFTNNRTMIPELHACILRLQSKNLLTIISNNRADRDYITMAIPGIVTQHIPSLCAYTNMEYSPKFNSFLVYTGEDCVPNHHLLIKRRELGSFKWDLLGKFKGIIHVPYEASTMSIFEHINSGIPLFFPTKRFLKELWTTQRSKFQSIYWNKFANAPSPDYLSETEKIDFWVDRADYYFIEGYYYFDSFEELLVMISSFTDVLKEKRTEYIRKNREDILTRFNDCI